jgi:hypothetical protein
MYRLLNLSFNQIIKHLVQIWQGYQVLIYQETKEAKLD